jgi:hypothetical protein
MPASDPWDKERDITSTISWPGVMMISREAAKKTNQ